MSESNKIDNLQTTTGNWEHETTWKKRISVSPFLLQCIRDYADDNPYDARFHHQNISSKKNNTPEKLESYCACNRCGSTKYCPTCNQGYKGKESFCPNCGNALTSMKEFENQDCPMCKNDTTMKSSKKGKVRRITPLHYNPTELLNPISPKRILKMWGYCNCGHYKPKGEGSSGCANCWGEANVIYS